MDQQKNKESSAYTDWYQESIGIETRVEFGMEPDEFYRRQVGVVLDGIPESLYGEGDLEQRPLGDEIRLRNDNLTLKERVRRAEINYVDRFDLDFGPGKRVLDLAVGEGDTSRYLATTGADVVARELEADPVENAKERDQEIRASISESQGSTREVLQNLGHVDYGTGDYGNIKEDLPEDSKGEFDAVTIMSRSFMYLLKRKNYQKALNDFFDLLKPGGKIAIQSRETISHSEEPGGQPAWADELDVGYVQLDNGDWGMRDSSGTVYAWTEPQKKKLDGGVIQTTDQRYLQYPDGSTSSRQTVTSDDRLNLKFLPMWRKMLEKAGFRNIQFKVEGLGPENSSIVWAIVAEKPQEKDAKSTRKGIRAGVGRLFGA